MQVIRAILIVTALGLMAGQGRAAEEAAPAQLAITNPPPAGVHQLTNSAAAKAADAEDAAAPMSYDVVVPQPPPPPEPAPVATPVPEVKIAAAKPAPKPVEPAAAETLPAKPAAPVIVAGTAQPATNNAAAPRVVRLSVQDKLMYSIAEDPVPGTQAELIAVNALGETNFRISRGTDMSIGLRVLGRTVDEVKEELKQKLDADFYNDAHVTLNLQDSAVKAGKVLFIGNGTRGGSLQILPGEELRIFEAVYQIGINQWTKLSEVILMRPDPATKKSSKQTIDLEKIKAGDRTDNVLLQDGDIIEVKEKKFLIQ